MITLTKRVRAREVIWVASMTLLSIITWVVVYFYLQHMEGKMDFAYIHSDIRNPYSYNGVENQELWGYCNWSILAAWGVAFPLRYLFLSTKWALRTMKDPEDQKEL